MPPAEPARGTQLVLSPHRPRAPSGGGGRRIQRAAGARSEEKAPAGGSELSQRLGVSGAIRGRAKSLAEIKTASPVGAPRYYRSGEVVCVARDGLGIVRLGPPAAKNLVKRRCARSQFSSAQITFVDSSLC
jgi:hypothetical protein